MSAWDIIRRAVANTFRSKTRTALTVVAIFIGAFTLTLTTAIGNGITSYIDAQMESIGGEDMLLVTAAADTEAAGTGPAPYDPAAEQPANAMPTLDDADLEAIRGTEGVRSVEAAVMLSPNFIEYGDNGKYELTVGPAASVADVDLAAGRQLDAGAEAPEVILPVSYVEAMGFDDVAAAPGSTVTIGVEDYAGTLHQLEATVVGVQNDSLFAAGAGMNTSLRAAIADIEAAGLPAELTGGYMMAFSYVEDGADEAATAAVKDALSAQGYTALTVSDQIGAVQTVLDGLIGVLNAFAVIALIAAGFGIVNTLLMSVQERTREIGLMKAMGMGSGRIFALFSTEAVVIGLLGAALGAGVAGIVGTTASNLLAAGPLADLPGLQIAAFDPATVAGIIGLVLLIAFIAGTLPAARAAKQNPIDALRYE